MTVVRGVGQISVFLLPVSFVFISANFDSRFTPFCFAGRLASFLVIYVFINLSLGLLTEEASGKGFIYPLRNRALLNIF